MSPGREIFVCEDHSSAPHEIVLLATDAEGVTTVAPFLELVNHPGSELTGACFNPTGDRMYFSSQRGDLNLPPLGLGVTYEVTGPFNT